MRKTGEKKKKEAAAPGSVRGVWAGNTILGDQQFCLQRCSLVCHLAFFGSFPFEMNIMLITGAKLTALKIEVPSYEIKCSKQQQEELFQTCLSISLHLGQEKMENS